MPYRDVRVVSVPAPQAEAERDAAPFEESGERLLTPSGLVADLGVGVRQEGRERRGDALEASSAPIVVGVA
jgi:hypothetical protein